ncbi:MULTISPECIES: histidinol dehydrogenase [Allobacillus]|uniref:Histidinol dehydrogenase n=1 Tax=Allobacillus halotolerans TaxID=570278 RepID=A0ABS6GM45_9BACI|nr:MULTISPECIES: histidinol dehydrogenase [Allobacillus]MBU6079715.1 histidinol dehydrogenase [Allobacillus halotolerans]TSJ68242.1 histidinol dehydrogenase [Allobacillus sp. SKP2-8]
MLNIETINQKQFSKISQQRTSRDSETYEEVDKDVQKIIASIRNKGDAAVFDYIERLDGVKLDELFVTDEEIDQAFKQVDDEMITILKEARSNIETYHKNQLEKSWYVNDQEGIWLGQQVTPIERVGVYVPGGKAAYPSTVLMNVVPAKVAGVESITVTTPVQPDGKVNPNTLVAVSIAGADRILKIGGAHGIATLAYGTESVDKVYKIVGPGNAYVARAKKFVFGDVAIDMIAGPSEVCIIADHQAEPRLIAADLLAQAEHDELASSILVTTSKQIATEVQQEVENQIKSLSRQDILAVSIAEQGRIYVVDQLNHAFEFVNELAPEHLEILVENPFEQLPKIKNAGAIFLGSYSPEPLGDYFAGPNHTLPTNGTAKFSSPLGVYDFQKKSSVIYYDQQSLEKANQKIQKFAQAERLDAHAASIRKRFE